MDSLSNFNSLYQLHDRLSGNPTLAGWPGAGPGCTRISSTDGSTGVCVPLSFGLLLSIVQVRTRLYPDEITRLSVNRRDADDWQKLVQLPESDFKAHVEAVRRNSVVTSSQKPLKKVKVLYSHGSKSQSS